MDTYTFDVETDGLLRDLTEIKCLNVINTETKEEFRFTDYEFYLDAWTGERTAVPTLRSGTIKEGLDLLDQGEIAGHNICGFDIMALQIVYPEWKPGPQFDTAVVSRLQYTDLRERDSIALRKGKIDLPKKLIGSHKLVAWGIRLGGEQKADFDPKTYGWTWESYPFSKECDDYCMQDVRTNVGLVEHFKKRLQETGVPEASVELEQAVAAILQRQMNHGWLYDVEAAQALTAELQKEVIEVTEKLQNVFPPFYKRDGKAEPFKKTMRRWVTHGMGAHVRKVKGEEVRGWYCLCSGDRMNIKLTQFNPGSRDHISGRLIAKYDWHPEKYTPSGKPQVDEGVLSELPWPEAKQCAEYFLVNKKLGQVSEGDKSQLKMVKSDNRMRGYVNHNGAVTGRMTHSGPNVAQTDKDARIRSLYIVPPGKKLVGCDADGLEACCLGHFLAIYDSGKYIKVILEGDKKNGTDTHSMNRVACGLNSRDNAKTIFYAWLYGSGDYNLGTIVYDDWDEAKQQRFNSRFSGQERNKRLARAGARARAALVGNISGMSKLIEKVKDKSKSPGFVRGLDRRRVLCRSAHAALNTLLQSAGALIMKKALVILDDVLQDAGLVPGVDYEFVGNIHDELQIEAEEKYAKFIGESAAAAIVAAGEFFKFRCPLAGSYDIGSNWSETH